MEDLSKEIKKKYIEELSGLIRTQHFVLFLFSSIVIHSYVNDEGQLYLWLWNHSIEEIVKNIFPSVKIGVMILAVAFVTLNSWIYRVIAGELFDLFSQAHNFEGFMGKISQRVSDIDPFQKDKLAKQIRVEVLSYRDVFNQKARSIELILGVAFLFLVNFALVDLIVSIVLICVVIYFIYKNYLLFVEKLSPALFLSQVLLEGEETVRGFFTESKK